MAKQPQYRDVALNFDLHPKQLEALSTPATEVLFGGATRGGKSHFSRVISILLCTLIPGFQVLMLRKFYDDIIRNHMEGHTGFRAMLAPYVDEGLVKITENQVKWVKTGSLITLEHMSTDEAAEKNQGVPKNLLIFEEACQLLERHMRFVRGWVTMDEEMISRIPPELSDLGCLHPSLAGCSITLPKIYYTANPIGVSMGYFRRNFVMPHGEGTVFKAPDDDGGFQRVYIEARVEHNPTEDKAATERRVKGMGDPGMALALLEARWDAPIGDYFPQWDDKRHSVEDFAVPTHWFKFLTFDWGSSEPFAVLWWAVSDGEPFIDHMKRQRWFPRGALVCYREWYGCDPLNPAKGLHLRNEEVAKGIIDRTYEATSGLIITDSFPFADRGMQKNGKEYRVADVFAENGCPLVKGNTARVTGWTQLRDRLIGYPDGDGGTIPMIYFLKACRYCRDYMPALGRHKTKPEDAVESGEATHCADAIRLACTTKPIVQEKKYIETGFKKPDIMRVCDIVERLERERLYG